LVAELRTARLILRPPVADDLPWILEYINTPAVMRHLGGHIRSPEEVAERLAADIAAFAGGAYRQWTVRLAADERRIGRCGLFRVRSEAAPGGLRGQSEIGWSLAEDAWGRGYATEAARAVLDHAFDTLAPAEVFSQTSDSNARSTRMMHRLGFRSRPELGYVDPDYPPQDNPTTVWSLDAPDWKQRCLTFESKPTA
jgi:RimJ/RimL family protein N-acetyltransferase